MAVMAMAAVALKFVWLSAWAFLSRQQGHASKDSDLCALTLCVA